MAEHCQFARFDMEGNEVYRCDAPPSSVVIRDSGDHSTIELCDAHRYWMPDMRWWREENYA